MQGLDSGCPKGPTDVKDIRAAREALRKVVELCHGTGNEQSDLRAAQPTEKLRCHDRNELRPEKFQHGPIEGTQKRLAQAILLKGTKDVRTLNQFADDSIWFVRIHRTLYRAWFLHKDKYDEVKKTSGQTLAETQQISPADVAH